MKLTQTVSLIIIIACLFSDVYSMNLRKKSKRHSLRYKKQPPPVDLNNEKEQEKIVLQKIMKRMNYAAFTDLLNALTYDSQALQSIKNAVEQELQGATIELTKIPVKSLSPTQNEIGMKNSLGFPSDNPPYPNLSKNKNYEVNIDTIFSNTFEYPKQGGLIFPQKKMIVETSDFFSTNPILVAKPIITLNSKYVLDGHHRWSELYMINPDALIVALNIKKDRITYSDALKILQKLLAEPSKKNTSSNLSNDFKNVFKMSNDEIEDYVKNNISKNFIKYLSYRTNSRNEEEAKQKLISNIKLFRDNVKDTIPCTATERKYMPQTDSIMDNLINKASNEQPIVPL